MTLLFDRGTLLLKTAHENPEKPADMKWDPRVNAYRAPGMNLVKLAIQNLTLTQEPRVQIPDADRWIRPELRPYQEAALQAWEDGGRRGVVILPTGAGKTRVALGAMAGLKKRVLVLVPTRVLLEQWEREIQ